jgi:IPT/TIG domain-containing protein
MKRALFLALCLCACGHAGSEADAGPDGGPGSDAGQTGGGDGDAGPFAPPEVKVRTVLPGSGPTGGGGTVLVSGSGFVEGFAQRGGSDTSARTTVLFGGVAATAVDVIDDNRVEVTAPAGAPGPASVAVTNPNGTGTCAGCYRYVTPVAVASIDPATGPPAGGTPVTVKGQGFTADLLLTVGGKELISPQVVDAQTVSGFAPPGLGAADVLAVTADGSGVLRRGYVYADATRVDGVAPAVTGTAGGEKIVISGVGFIPVAAVQIDGADAPSAWIDAEHIELFAPAHAAGAVDVSVDGAALAQGLVYADPGGAPQAYAVQPPHGPLAGGACPGACVHVYGSGLTGLSVSVGGAVATVHPVSDVQLDADLPQGAAPGAVDVQVGAQTLSSAFSYDALLAVSSIAPAEAPASGSPPVQVTLTGSGFDLPGLQVFIGALPALPVAATATSITVTAPAGSPGPADIRVVAGGFEARLSGAFSFTEPLSIAQVSPALGAQAGGTRVTLYGRGFTAALAASIDGAAVSGLVLATPTEAVGLTPPGTAGAQTVAVAQGGAQAALDKGFTYFDPTAAQGGGTGGPLLGALNVTVLDGSAYKDGGVPGAFVQVILHDGAVLTGATDTNGQVTFSDDRLVLPAQVTASKEQYDAITVLGVRTSNLTVSIQGPAGNPPPPPDPPPPPPPPPPALQSATVSGHVFGFKLPPGTVLSATQRPVARVAIARAGIYALPPFSGAPAFFTVATDGGPYLFDKLFSLSPMTLYAVFGIEDSATNPATFEPLLLGIVRGVQPDPAKPVGNADIILDTHLDQTVDVTVLDAPSVLGGHDAFVDLDLGQAGAIPLDRVTQNTDPAHLHFRHLPKAAGQGFVFVDQFGRFSNGILTTPVSTYLRRVFGDVSGGVTLGPLLPFPVLQQEGPNSFSWTLGDSPLQPNLQQLRVQDGTATQDTSWSVLLPGDARQVTMPDALRSRLQKGPHGFSLVISVSPSFDFAHWTYNDLFSGSWTAYAFADGTFTVP